MHLRMAVVVGALTLAHVLVAPQAGAASSPWSESLPTTGDVVVPAGVEVVLDTDLVLETLVIDGTVRCGGASVSIEARWILINGAFECGTRRTAYTGELTITLTGPGTGDHHHAGDKFIAVTPGGRLDLHGERRRTWTHLTEPAQPGDSRIHVADPVWGPGDRIVIAPTNYEADQAETAVVIARTGTRLTLAEPLRWQHWCGTDTFGRRQITSCAEVGLLTHNITIQGDAASEATGIGGHMMFMPDTTVRLRAVRLHRMGQRSVLARYPVHWHHAGDVGRRGWIRDSSIERSFNRFVTIHGTHGVTVRGVVGYDTIGHGFYLEDGIETGNKLIGNLAVLVRRPVDGEALTPSDEKASAFWISNPDNVVNRNVAAGAPHAGFSLSFPEHPVGMSATSDVWPSRTPLRSFAGNTAHTIGFAGVYVDGGEDASRNIVTTWYEPHVDPADPGSEKVTPVLRRFTAWKVRHYGAWIRTRGGVRLLEARLADNWRSIFLANIASGPDHANVGVIARSLLVGTSSNHGIPESWERVDANGHTLPRPWDPDTPIGGVPFYDGPMEVRRTTLANFKPNATRDAGALTSVFPNEFSISVHNQAAGLRIQNSKRVLFGEPGEGRQGDAGTLFLDLTGSVTGTAKATVVAAGTLLDDQRCEVRGAWNAAVCTGVGFARIGIGRDDGNPMAADVTRDDGRTIPVRAANGGGWMTINLQMGRAHVVDPEHGAPPSYSFWVHDHTRPGAIRLAVPAPSGAWDVTIWGPDRGRVWSLDELDSGEAGWYHDPVTGLIHLRFTDDARGGEVG